MENIPLEELNDFNAVDKLIKQFNTVKDKIVVSFIEKNETDPNWRKYPAKKNFELKAYEELPSYIERRGDCCVSVMFPPGGPYKKEEPCYLEMSIKDVREMLCVAYSNVATFFKECKYHKILFQNADDPREPFDVLTGDEDNVTSKLQDYFKNKKITTQETWSGAGFNELADRLEVYRDFEVTGVPEYGQKTIYPIAYKLSPNTTLSLREAQKLIVFGETETAYRHVTYGTGYRVRVRLTEKDESFQTGRVWVSNNPLD